jgi:hypothetical protein
MKKVIEIDNGVLQALELLAHDNAVSLQALADEAFRALLKRHDRPANLEEALRMSLRRSARNDNGPAIAKKVR